MQVIFHYGNHKIVLERTFTRMQLLVDGDCVSKRDGILVNQVKNAEFSALIKNSDATEDNVLVRVTMGGVMDSATLLYNGKEIDTKQFL